MLLVRNYTILFVLATLSATALIVLSSFLCLLLSLFISVKAYGEMTTVLPQEQEQVRDSVQQSRIQDIETASINQLLPEGVLITQSLIDSPMPMLKNSKLGQLLTRYYNKCLGGADNWQTIKSIKISANLDTIMGIYQYEAFIKNPNLYKISISSEGSTDIVAFDGNSKWQKHSTEEEDFFPEISPKMKRTIYEPELTTFLLYPLKKGKTFQYIGTVREFNTVCHHLRLFSEQGYLIDYFIDVESYFIVTVQIIDTLKEFSPVLIRYSDHRLVEGVYCAHKIESFLDGQWDSTLNVQSITFNSGVANWMFNLEDNAL